MTFQGAGFARSHGAQAARFANAIVTASQASKKDRPDKLNFHQQQLTTNSPVGQMNKHTRLRLRSNIFLPN
ncbi:hypothetical protein NDI47_08095 [Microcoleus vaginatus GB1-A2]|uniref:hypothetical protein n=1 Tax=Microcoleus vaginatus TaxID=119532 RepID=UPI001689898C|nr:hypothetical protein [Microcoleus sp. FACHB-61]